LKPEKSGFLKSTHLIHNNFIMPLMPMCMRRQEIWFPLLPSLFTRRNYWFSADLSVSGNLGIQK